MAVNFSFAFTRYLSCWFNVVWYSPEVEPRRVLRNALRSGLDWPISETVLYAFRTTVINAASQLLLGTRFATVSRKVPNPPGFPRISRPSPASDFHRVSDIRSWVADSTLRRIITWIQIFLINVCCARGRKIREILAGNSGSYNLQFISSPEAGFTRMPHLRPVIYLPRNPPLGEGYPPGGVSRSVHSVFFVMQIRAYCLRSTRPSVKSDCFIELFGFFKRRNKYHCEKEAKFFFCLFIESCSLDLQKNPGIEHVIRID